MQDDPRNRLDTAANGLRPGQSKSTATTTAGDVNGSQSLTESKLSRHTRLYPPDARDTVAWYLRGLEPVLEAGNVDSQNRVGKGSPQADKHRRSPKEVIDQGHIKIIDDCHIQGLAQGRSVASETNSLPPHLRATMPALTRTNLIDARKALVASMKSKKEYKNQIVHLNPIDPPNDPVPTPRHSSHSSTCELHQPLNQPQKGTRSHRAESEELIVDPHIRIKQRDKFQEKRKLSDTGSGDRNRKESKHKHAKRPSSHAAGLEDDLPAVEANARKDEHRKLLDQRRERRRAKAVIVKDRSKVTAPSDNIVKANKKASKMPDLQESSKYRKAEEAPKDNSTFKRRSKESRGGQESKPPSVVSGGDHDEHRITYQISSKKRTSDVQRNMAALKEASKGRRQSGKRKRHDPLERAANILPAGRVTLKAKTGIYNHGQASTKHAIQQRQSPKKLTDLAFCELPFLNQPLVEASTSRLIHKTVSGAYGKRNTAPRQHPSAQEDSGALAGVATALQSMPSSVASRTSDRCQSPREIANERPKSPKQVNVENFAPARRSARAPPSKKKPSGVHSTEQTRVDNRPVHRMQGLSLESRDIISSPTVSHSRQATGETTSGSSRILSTIAESGQQLSSLTGLSAGSSVRRRLLRRMDRVAVPLEPRSAGEELQRELRAFRSSENIAPQTHGPSAKYGSATIAPRALGPIPDVPRPEQKHRPPMTSPAIYHQGSISTSHPVNRSPDWFASNESFATDTINRNSQLQATPSHHTINRDTYLQPRDLQPQSLNYFRQPVDRAIDYDLTANSPHYPSFQVQPTQLSEDYPQERPQEPDPCYDPRMLHYQGAYARDGFNMQPQHAAPDPDNIVPPPNYRWELVEVPQAHPTMSQVGPSSPYMPASAPIIAHRPPIYHPEPDYVPYIEDAAPFQRGRTDLYSNVPHTSSPAQLQPLRGFWQRNYL